MSTPLPISSGLSLDRLTKLNSCDVSDAIERFDIRLRNQGFTDSSIQCRFQSSLPLVGFAITVQIRSANPPITGGHLVEHSEWWETFDAIPAPRILVIEDVDPHPGVGAFVGKTHAHVFKALGVVGIVTNGAVRDMAALETIGMKTFSGSVSISHAYAHLVAVGTTVHIGGLAISPGDILHGNAHGVLQVPTALLDLIPTAVQEHVAEEQRIIDLCYAEDFSVATLREAIERDGWPGGRRSSRK